MFVPTTVIPLSTSWKFATDPTSTGVPSGWMQSSFNDSAWQTLLSGSSWENQGITYAGYAWYRQTVTISLGLTGADLRITLASFPADDDVYWNGVRIGGRNGAYKYANLALRTYCVPASMVQTTNVIAIRFWGGPTFQVGNNASGLIAGTYTITAYNTGLYARPTGGTTSQEVPVETFDLSAAQNGMTWELVIRAASGSGNMRFAITDFYGGEILFGWETPIVGGDGITRIVISIGAATSRMIYLAGRFQVQVNPPPWVDTGKQIVSTSNVTEEVYSLAFQAGVVNLPPQDTGTFTGTYHVLIPDNTVVISGLTVYTTNAHFWSVLQNFQVGNQVYGDSTAYRFTAIDSAFVGGQWIQSAAADKYTATNPLVSFTIDRPTTIYVSVDTRSSHLPWNIAFTADNLTFTTRDTQVLPAPPSHQDTTPYGLLTLVDTINCATDTAHPYMQSGLDPSAAVTNNTPGSQVEVTVSTILGIPAREVTSYGWFAYKIGAGGLTPGNTYLLRIQYPEDMPRYCPIIVEAGQNFQAIGWRNGIDPADVYDPWPLSGAWQFYDVIVPLGVATVGQGSSDDADAATGFWVYFMNKCKRGSYFSIYEGGPAIASMSLYAIDPVGNAPVIVTPPSPLPQRILTFDWEREPTGTPSAMCAYAKLMGYNAISPIAGIKWSTRGFHPVAGYDTNAVDPHKYWTQTSYVVHSGIAPPLPSNVASSVHAQYLAATAAAGINYWPRIEYGGSYDLPTTAQAIGADGNVAKPDRYATWGADLLNPATFTDFTNYLDAFVAPFTAANPQFKGIFWRIREDRMQISYSAADATLFSTSTSTPLPTGFSTMTAAQVATWLSVTIGAPYTTWWHQQREAFHMAIVAHLQGIRSDLSVLYYNWDSDKFSLSVPDINTSNFYANLANVGGPAAFLEEREARIEFTSSNYVADLNAGNFQGAITYVVRPEINKLWPDYAVRPSLYTTPGFQILCPLPWLCYASDSYVQYFQTASGVAVANPISYDELSVHEPNPKFEGSMMLSGGGAFSMAMEVLAWYHGDAFTLTLTTYTPGRGFADAHRRFAQAFLALPATAGTPLPGMPANIVARVYASAGVNKYLGVANIAMTAQSVSIPVVSGTKVTNLVTGSIIPVIGGMMTYTIGPMELDSFIAS